MGQRRKQSITSYIFTVLTVQSDGSRNICPNLVSLLRVTLYATSYAVWQGSVILNGGSQRVSPKCHRQQWSEAIILTNPNKKLFHKDVNVLDTSKRRERVRHFPNLTPARQSDIPEHTENAAFELWGKGSLEDGLHGDKLPAGAWKLERERCKIQSAEGEQVKIIPVKPSPWKSSLCEAKHCLQPVLSPIAQ